MSPVANVHVERSAPVCVSPVSGSRQEIVFASTGAKLKGDPPDKYVAALVGDGIQTNPPATIDAMADSGATFTRTIDQMPPKQVLDEIDAKVDMRSLEETLMSEGTAKFADPHKALLKLIAEKRGAIAATT